MGNTVFNHGKLLKAFDYAQIFIGGKPFRAIRIVCAKCERTAVTRMNSMAGGPSADTKEHRKAARRFSQDGWEVGLKAARHRCPDCSQKSAVAVPAEPQKEESMVLKLAPAANAPREMSRDDRRIIFEKLNDVYVDDKRGYSAPWTDKKVAEDLGVPRAWVEQVRDEMFGPVRSNPDIDEAIQKAAALVDEMKALDGRIAAIADEAQKLRNRSEQVERKLADLQRSVSP